MDSQIGLQIGSDLGRQTRLRSDMLSRTVGGKGTGSDAPCADHFIPVAAIRAWDVECFPQKKGHADPELLFQTVGTAA